MAEHREASGSLALSRRPRRLAKPVVSSAFSNAKTLSGNPAQPAEIAQARVFERLLQAECAELQDLAQRLAQDEPAEAGPFGELTQIRARIDEVDALLRALQGRFPRSVPDGDR